MKSIIKITKALVLVIVVIGFSLFSFQNADHVSFRFFTYRSPELPFFIVIIACVLFGAAVAGALGFLEIMHLNQTIRKLRKEAKALKEKIDSLHNLPLAENFKTAAAETEHDSDNKAPNPEATP